MGAAPFQPPPVLPPTEAIGALVDILAAAYGDGSRKSYDDLDRVVSSNFEWRLGVDFGGFGLGSRELVSGVMDRVEQEGVVRFRTAVVAFFKALPWNEPLRDWVGRFQAPDLGAVSDADFQLAREHYERISSVSDALEDIRKTRNEAVVAKEIAAAHDDLEAVADRLRALSAFKGVHDLLHEIQIGVYQPVATLVLGKDQLASDDADQIETFAASLDGTRVRIESNLELLASAGTKAEDAPDTAWLEDLKDAAQPLGCSPLVLADLRSCVFALRMVLRQQLTVYDAAIIDAADKIPFGGVVEFLRRAGALDALPDAVAAAGGDLSELETELGRLVRLHESWQQIDAILWQIDQELGPRTDAVDPGLIGFQWRQLDRRLEAVAKDNAALWDANIDAARGKVRDSLAPGGPLPAAAVGALNGMVRIARLQFAKVDKVLLAQCNQVVRLCGPIQALVREAP